MKIKERIEEWWIASEFSFSKNQLIAAAVLAILIIAGWLYYYFQQSPAKVPIKVSKAPAQDAQNKDSSSKLYVHVAGAVKTPGVYLLKEGSRVIEAIEKAGGFAKEADQDSLNLAAKVVDSQKIVVSTKTADSNISASAKPSVQTESLINLNTATEEQLDELPGIGEVMAKRILEYRTEIGAFKSVEQLKDVEGIGPKKFDRIKDKVTL